MLKKNTWMLALAVMAIAATASDANAQRLRFSIGGHGGRLHIDHDDRVVRDSHGHIISRHHGGNAHRNWDHIVPRYQTNHSGSYYSSGGRYYYAPQTAGIGQAPAPVAVQFGSFSHVDDLAVRLEGLTNELCLDLHYNYQHNHGFRETYAEAYQILQVAKFIHDAEHAQDRQAIAARLGGLDALFHHVEDDVRGWSRHHHRQIGSLGILTKMEYIESTLHHLMNDVGVQAAPQGPEQAPAPGGVELAPPPIN